MKKLSKLCLILLGSVIHIYGQSTIISPQGVMFPQLSTTQINALTSQAKGTMVFDNILNVMKYWDGSVWENVSNVGASGSWQTSGADQYSTNSGNVGIGSSSPNNKLTIQTSNNSYGMIHSNSNIEVGTYIGGNAGWIGTKSEHPLIIHSNNGANQSTVLSTGQWGIGTTNPNPTAQLEVYSVDKGFLPPRLTLIASDSPNPIASTPPDGTIVYNNNVNALSGVGLYMWKNIGWVKVNMEDCPLAYSNCGGNCVNFSTNSSNCGACGNVCPSGQSCVNGICSISCPPGYTICGNNCVLDKSDSNNCGACGNVCPSGQSCVNGICSTSCPPGYTRCGNNCVLTNSDSNNCGACGIVCPSGKSCVNGTCQ